MKKKSLFFICLITFCSLIVAVSFSSLAVENHASKSDAQVEIDEVTQVETLAETMEKETKSEETTEPSALLEGLEKDGSGKWNYYKAGVVDNTYTGLANNEYGTWYVVKGTISFVTGMYKMPSSSEKQANTWVYIENGKFTGKYTGMAKNDYGWWYMKSSVLDKTYTGMAKNEWGYWHMISGKLDYTGKGLVYINKNSAYYKDSWLYLKDGKLDTSYTAMAKNKWGWWHVEKGVLQRTYTGMSKNEYGTWYFKNGRIAESFYGNVKFNGTLYYIKAGKSIPAKKIIFLTFDDGPSQYTGRLLDILKKYDVKATFFVTGANSNYFNMIGRAAKEGHTVALHTYNHNYKTIYSSEKAYYNDLAKINDLVYKQTGSYSKMLRFPGGSSNTVSRKYCKGIMTTLSKSVQQRGYVYFDWDVVSGDAGDTTSTSKVYSNVVNGVSSRSNTYTIVLQHDSKKFSIDAVESIIKWGQSNGYTFLPLTMDSPTAHQRIAN